MAQSDYIRLRTQSQTSVFLRKVRVALTPRSWKLTALLSCGARVRGQNRAGWGGRGAYIFRDDLEPELGVLPRFLGKGGVMLDIGANVGVYSVVGGMLVGSGGTVIGVEPFPSMLAQLHENVLFNGLGGVVRLRSLCVSDQTGPVTFWMNHGKPHSFSLIRSGNADGFAVLSVKLDDLARWEKLERLDYLKIDAEGAEEGILNGGRDVILRFRPVIQVEDERRTLWRLVPDCTTFEVPGTRNSLMIPNEKMSAAGDLEKEGWKRVVE